MNYEPNNVSWNLGDVVIHDADAKQPAMLMIVVGVRSDGYVHTRYAYGHVDEQVYCNHREMLHDPARFGIEVKT